MGNSKLYWLTMGLFLVVYQLLYHFQEIVVLGRVIRLKIVIVEATLDACNTHARTHTYISSTQFVLMCLCIFYVFIYEKNIFYLRKH